MELSPTPPTSQDFPDHWGFYLLPAISPLDDNMNQVSREQQRTADYLRQDIGGIRQEIHALGAKLDHKVDALDAKFEQKLNAWQYWSWGTLVVLAVITL